jgi:hypothetical protein
MELVPFLTRVLPISKRPFQFPVFSTLYSFANSNGTSSILRYRLLDIKRLAVSRSILSARNSCLTDSSNVNMPSDRPVWMCVSMPSEATLISIPPKGADASTNHCISASCSARVRTDRLIVLSRNDFAASISATAGVDSMPRASTTAVVDLKFMFILFVSPLKRTFFSKRPASVAHLPVAIVRSTPSERQARRKSNRRSAHMVVKRQSDQAKPD